MRIFLFAIPLFCIVTANAETWECQAGTVWGERQILVKATSYENGNGAIEVAGTTHKTVYAVNGFDRAWSWDLDAENHRYSYSFIVLPTGAAEYYDFRKAYSEGETVTLGSQRYTCRDSAADAIPTEPPVTEDMPSGQFDALLDEYLPSGYIKNPETIADCAANRDLYRAQQLENIIGMEMNEFVETEELAKLAMTFEDSARSGYEACVAWIDCVDAGTAVACARAAFE